MRTLVVPTVLGVVVVAMMAAVAQAGPVAPETLSGIVKKADYLVVGQVIKVQELGADASDVYKMPLVHKRALLRVLRGMKSADATGADFVTIAVDYYAVKEQVPEGPAFPQLWVDEIGLFPIKAGGAGGGNGQWRFASEEDNGLIAPAVPTELSVGWPANVDRNIAFIYREVAGAFLYGDFAGMTAAAAYLDKLGDAADKTADPIFGLIRAEVGESLLKEDGRWMSIGTAGYVSSGVPRPTLDAIINGMAAPAGGAARAPTDGLPTRASLRLAALAFKRASKSQLMERVLMLLISHQEDPGMQWGIAKALVDNFDGAPMLVSMEEALLHNGKPGAMYVADYMIKDEAHPLAPAASVGAREVMGFNGVARDFDASVAYSPLLRESVGILLRAGSDEDFGFLLTTARQASERDFKTYQGILLLAGDSELSPAERVEKLCAVYIDDRTAMTKGPYPGLRLCDWAALTVARVGKQDFGMSPTDAVEKRDQAVAKAAAWLKKQP